MRSYLTPESREKHFTILAMLEGGMNRGEIAEKLNMPKPRVEKIIRRAIKEREILEGRKGSLSTR